MQSGRARQSGKRAAYVHNLTSRVGQHTWSHISCSTWCRMCGGVLSARWHTEEWPRSQGACGRLGHTARSRDSLWSTIQTWPLVYQHPAHQGRRRRRRTALRVQNVQQHSSRAWRLGPFPIGPANVLSFQRRTPYGGERAYPRLHQHTSKLAWAPQGSRARVYQLCDTGAHAVSWEVEFSLPLPSCPPHP